MNDSWDLILALVPLERMRLLSIVLPRVLRHVKQHYRDACHLKHIGDIEDPGPQRPDANVQEIDDMPFENNAINPVTQATPA